MMCVSLCVCVDSRARPGWSFNGSTPRLPAERVLNTARDHLGVCSCRAYYPQRYQYVSDLPMTMTNIIRGRKERY